jgi:hypothetical protein
MTATPDFTDAEITEVRVAVQQRFGRAIEPDLAESEIRLDANDRELTVCPALYWKERGCHFVILKTGTDRFRSQFFYSVREQYGTGIEEYDNITDCVLTLLKLQADQESLRADSAG